MYFSTLNNFLSSKLIEALEFSSEMYSAAYLTTEYFTVKSYIQRKIIGALYRRNLWSPYFSCLSNQPEVETLC
jgi:hypothetical protein